jgi:hypothetical protein
MLAVVVEMLTLSGGGVFKLLLILIVSIILIVLKVVIYFKVLMIYIKMVFSTITAPLEFVLGAVPGSEAKIQDWFKRMAKYSLSIFFMGLVIPITLLMGLSVALAYSAEDSLGGEMGGLGNLMAVLAPLVIVILGFSIGLSAEKRVETMFFGGKSK